MHAGQQADAAVGLGAGIGQKVLLCHFDIETAQQIGQDRKGHAAAYQQPDERAQQARQRTQQSLRRGGLGGFAH